MRAYPQYWKECVLTLPLTLRAEGVTTSVTVTRSVTGLACVVTPSVAETVFCPRYLPPVSHKHLLSLGIFSSEFQNLQTNVILQQPVLPVKEGACSVPQSLNSIFLPEACKMSCRDDSQCGGEDKCCFTGCGYMCSKPTFDTSTSTHVLLLLYLSENLFITVDPPNTDNLGTCEKRQYWIKWW